MPKLLAEIVLEEGLADDAELERAAAAADRDGSPLVVALVREVGVDEVALVAALRRHVRVQTGDPATVSPDPEAVRELSRDVCRRQRVVPLDVSSPGGLRRVLRLAMADPTDAAAQVEIEQLTGCTVVPVLMTISAIEELVEKTYRHFVTEVMKRDPGRGRGRPFPPAAAQPSRLAARPPEAEGPEGPSTVPFHRLADEADLEIRLQALVQLLIAKGLISDDELEEEVRQVMRQQEPD